MAEIRIAEVSDVKENEGKEINVNGKSLALLNSNGKFFVIDNICLHKGCPLYDGFLEDNKLTCGCHGWQYDITSGQNIMPGEGKLRTYKVIIKDQDIFIEI